jgi:hypothetical protein
MKQACSGCAWIAGEVERRKDLAAQFEAQGDHRLAEIAIEGIAALGRDWQAHCQRDHAGGASESLLALRSAIQGQFAAVDPADDPAVAATAARPPAT